MLRYHPLLRQQRELYNVPRGPQRFRAYLSLMLNEAQNEMELPLAAFNPMGKEDVAIRLDQWIQLGADEIAAQSIADVSTQVNDLPAEFRIALVLCDDRGGTWSNHAATEFTRRFETGALLRRRWIEGSLWTSQHPSPQLAREAVLLALFRALYIQRYGAATTLEGMLVQERYAAEQAGCLPKLENATHSKVRQIVAAHAKATEWPILMACLFGDPAAEELGLPPVGMPAGGALSFGLYSANDL